jgi:hypothetical protein
VTLPMLNRYCRDLPAGSSCGNFLPRVVKSALTPLELARVLGEAHPPGSFRSIGCQLSQSYPYRTHLATSIALLPVNIQPVIGAAVFGPKYIARE